MKITTKFKPNQNIWYRNESDGDILSGTVSKISVDIQPCKTNIEYFIKTSDGYTGFWHNWVKEEKLFMAQKEVL